MKEMLEKILEKLKGAKKVVFMGIGEEKLSDDGVGPYIITNLLDFSNEKFLFINAGVDPMARIDDVMNFNPSHLVLIDTCTLNKESGTVALIERENLSEYVSISSHTIPIHVVIDLISERIINLKTFMIGIVPESLEGFIELKMYKEDVLSLEEKAENIDLPFFEINLTDTIKNAADEIIKILIEIIKVI